MLQIVSYILACNIKIYLFFWPGTHPWPGRQLVTRLCIPAPLHSLIHSWKITNITKKSLLPKLKYTKSGLMASPLIHKNIHNKKSELMTSFWFRVKINYFNDLIDKTNVLKWIKINLGEESQRSTHWRPYSVSSAPLNYNHAPNMTRAVIKYICLDKGIINPSLTSQGTCWTWNIEFTFLKNLTKWNVLQRDFA